MAYTGADAAAFLEEPPGNGSTASASGAAAAAPTLPKRDQDRDDDMTDTETAFKDKIADEIKEMKEDLEHERSRRKDLENEVKRVDAEHERTEKVVGAIAHTTSKIVDAVMKNEQLWLHSVLIIKRKTLKMHEYYTRINTLEVHLRSKQDVWANVVTVSSAGPATTIVAKTKTAQQVTLDAVKAWANTEGVSRELSIFKSKEQLKKMRKKR